MPTAGAEIVILRLQPEVEDDQGPETFDRDGVPAARVPLAIPEDAGPEPLVDRIHELLDEGCRSILLDLSGMPPHDLEIKLIVKAKDACLERGAELVLADVPENLASLVSVLNLEDEVRIFDSTDEAVDALVSSAEERLSTRADEVRSVEIDMGELARDLDEAPDGIGEGPEGWVAVCSVPEDVLDTLPDDLAVVLRKGFFGLVLDLRELEVDEETGKQLQATCEEVGHAKVAVVGFDEGEGILEALGLTDVARVDDVDGAIAHHRSRWTGSEDDTQPVEKEAIGASPEGEDEGDDAEDDLSLAEEGEDYFLFTQGGEAREQGIVERRVPVMRPAGADALPALGPAVAEAIGEGAEEVLIDLSGASASAKHQLDSLMRSAPAWTGARVAVYGGAGDLPTLAKVMGLNLPTRAEALEAAHELARDVAGSAAVPPPGVRIDLAPTVVESDGEEAVEEMAERGTMVLDTSELEDDMGGDGSMDEETSGDESREEEPEELDREAATQLLNAELARKAASEDGDEGEASGEDVEEEPEEEIEELDREAATRMLDAEMARDAAAELREEAEAAEEDEAKTRMMDTSELQAAAAEDADEGAEDEGEDSSEAATRMMDASKAMDAARALAEEDEKSSEAATRMMDTSDLQADEAAEEDDADSEAETQMLAVPSAEEGKKEAEEALSEEEGDEAGDDEVHEQKTRMMEAAPAPSDESEPTRQMEVASAEEGRKEAEEALEDVEEAADDEAGDEDIHESKTVQLSSPSKEDAAAMARKAREEAMEDIHRKSTRAMQTPDSDEVAREVGEPTEDRDMAGEMTHELPVGEAAAGSQAAADEMGEEEEDIHASKTVNITAPSAEEAAEIAAEAGEEPEEISEARTMQMDAPSAAEARELAEQEEGISEAQTMQLDSPTPSAVIRAADEAALDRRTSETSGWLYLAVAVIFIGVGVGVSAIFLGPSQTPPEGLEEFEAKQREAFSRTFEMSPDEAFHPPHEEER